MYMRESTCFGYHDTTGMILVKFWYVSHVVVCLLLLILFESRPLVISIDVHHRVMHVQYCGMFRIPHTFKQEF